MPGLQRINVLLMICFTFAACSVVQGCDKTTNAEKGANIPMKIHYIGRFSIAVPVEMKLEKSTSELAYVKIDEIVWPKNVSHEQARIVEWNNFMEVIKKLDPPKGKNEVIIKSKDFPGVGQWAKGIYYYYADFRPYDGKWALLMDAGPVGVWLKGNSVVDKENVNHYLEQNIETSGKSYKYVEWEKQIRLPQGDFFYLEHGAISLPYEEQEESYARFKSQHLDMVLEIKMEMDIGHYRESMGLIEKTKSLLTEAALEPGISMSKIRLDNREVAGMKGEESILRESEKGTKKLVFTWEFNGKEDSGEYPTTTIEMESTDVKLDEKIKIWDAVLDSMKPMFERKK
jgi:hypothetical protein